MRIMIITAGALYISELKYLHITKKKTVMETQLVAADVATAAATEEEAKAAAAAAATRALRALKT